MQNDDTDVDTNPVQTIEWAKGVMLEFIKQVQEGGDIGVIVRLAVLPMLLNLDLNYLQGRGYFSDMPDFVKELLGKLAMHGAAMSQNIVDQEPRSAMISALEEIGAFLTSKVVPVETAEAQTEDDGDGEPLH